MAYLRSSLPARDLRLDRARARPRRCGRPRATRARCGCRGAASSCARRTPSRLGTGLSPDPSNSTFASRAGRSTCLPTRRTSRLTALSENVIVGCSCSSSERPVSERHERVSALPSRLLASASSMIAFEVDAGVRPPWAEPPRLVAVTDDHGLLQAPLDRGLQLGARSVGLQPADVDAGDADALGDRVRPRVVVGVGGPAEHDERRQDGGDDDERTRAQDGFRSQNTGDRDRSHGRLVALQPGDRLQDVDPRPIRRLVLRERGERHRARATAAAR